MILHHTNSEGGEPQGSPTFSPSCNTAPFDCTRFLLLLADYCRHLATARKRSILTGELAAYSSVAADDGASKAWPPSHCFTDDIPAATEPQPPSGTVSAWGMWTSGLLVTLAAQPTHSIYSFHKRRSSGKKSPIVQTASTTENSYSTHDLHLHNVLKIALILQRLGSYSQMLLTGFCSIRVLRCER